MKPEGAELQVSIFEDFVCVCDSLFFLSFDSLAPRFVD